jgi:hypothetical protein
MNLRDAMLMNAKHTEAQRRIYKSLVTRKLIRVCLRFAHVYVGKLCLLRS